MKTDYTCPHCNNHLLLENKLILTARLASSNELSDGFLLLMNPEIGHYDIHLHPAVEVQEGEKYDFFCPVCHHKLHSDLNENLVMIQYQDKDGKLFELHFSKISGQKSTYKIMGRSVETFGIDAPHYLDYINLIDMS